VRWWLFTDEPRIFSVDNSSVSGMDFSDLLEDEPDIWMVQWIEGRGEIERQTDDKKNLNGLRERFIDITPYAPLFQQFLDRMQAKALLLPQAKTIQIELIAEIYNAKRQAPFYYPVAAGNYWWDASDASSAVNPASSIQTVISTLNALISKVNTLAHEINSIVVTQVNANVVGGVNSTVVAGVNAGVVAGINAVIVTPFNTLVGNINASIVTACNNAFTHYNGVIDTENAKLHTGSFYIPSGEGSTQVNAAMPGLDGGVNLPHNPYFCSGLGDGAGAIGGIGGIAGIAGINWSDQAAVGALPGGSFVPIGSTTPVALTSAEIAGIQNGIAARANDLSIKKNRKIGEVNALITVPAVIAYDVTTGW
jgi:hypothetical protein